MDKSVIRQYPVGELERRAFILLRERCKPAITVPVDIDFLVEQEPGMDLDIWPGLMDSYQVAGLVCKEPSGIFVIYIDARIADAHPNFYRFTVAEELAHIHLHRGILEEVKSFGDSAALQESNEYHRLDRNAKRFAAALLMPSTHLPSDANRLYKQLVRNAGYRDPIAVEKYLVDRLSRQYEVSAQAMRHRLGEWPINIMDKMKKAMRDRVDRLD